MGLFEFRRLLLVMAGACVALPAAGQDAGEGKDDRAGPVSVQGYVFSDRAPPAIAVAGDSLAPVAVPGAMLQPAGNAKAVPPVAAGWALDFQGFGGGKGGVVVEGGGSPAARGVSLGALVDPGGGSGQVFVAAKSRDWRLGEVSARSSQRLEVDQPSPLSPAPAPASVTLRHTLEVEAPWHDTSLRLDSSRSSGGEAWLHRLEASQTLLGPISVSAKVEELSPRDAAVGFSTRLKLDW